MYEFVFYFSFFFFHSIFLLFFLSFTHYNIRIINVCCPLRWDCDTTVAGVEKYMCFIYIATKARQYETTSHMFSLDIDVWRFFFSSLNCKLQDSGIWQFYEWNRCVRSKSFTSIWQHTWISYSRWIGHDVRSAHFIQWHGIHKAVCLDVIWQAGNRVYIIFLFPWKKEDVLLSTSRHMTVFGLSE